MTRRLVVQKAAASVRSYWYVFTLFEPQSRFFSTNYLEPELICPQNESDCGSNRVQMLGDAMIFVLRMKLLRVELDRGKSDARHPPSYRYTWCVDYYYCCLRLRRIYELVQVKRREFSPSRMPLALSTRMSRIKYHNDHREQWKRVT